MSGLASLQLRQLSRAARFLPCSPVASGSSLAPAGIPLSLVRQLSVSAALSAKGQGGREVKVKKTPKGRENVGKGGKGKNKAAEEEEEEDDDDSSGGGRKAPRRTNEPNESDVIDAEVAKADDKMSKSVDWLAEKFAESVARVRGQVSPGTVVPAPRLARPRPLSRPRRRLLTWHPPSAYRPPFADRQPSSTRSASSCPRTRARSPSASSVPSRSRATRSSSTSSTRRCVSPPTPLLCPLRARPPTRICADASRSLGFCSTPRRSRVRSTRPTCAA